MVNSTKRKQTGSIACPQCSAASGGSFTAVEEADDAAPIEVLYKCRTRGGFYTAERVISWRH